jgi:hypothetical protein
MPGVKGRVVLRELLVGRLRDRRLAVEDWPFQAIRGGLQCRLAALLNGSVSRGAPKLGGHRLRGTRGQSKVWEVALAAALLVPPVVP